MTDHSRVAGERGSILLVLLVMVCLASIVMSSLWVASMEWTLSSANAEQVQAFALAESGLDHAVALLDDGDVDFNADLAGPDGATGTADDGQIFDAPISLDSGYYDVRILDNDDGDGDTTVDSDDVVYLLATGTVDEITRQTRIEVTVDADGALQVLEWREET